jgi:hypothetical protein
MAPLAACPGLPLCAVVEFFERYSIVEKPVKL